MFSFNIFHWISMHAELIEKYAKRKDAIAQRLADFKAVFGEDDSRVFAELCFCLLTPQSKARHAWRAIENLAERRLLLNGNAQQIEPWLGAVRFYKNKAKWIEEARAVFADGASGVNIKEKLLACGSVPSMREWLVANVKGMGYKEASHFLRNVGFGDDIAILDRHILKNLAKYGVIEEAPRSLTDKKYLEIEQKMREFASAVGVPLAHLDLLFWSEETGEIFK